MNLNLDLFWQEIQKDNEAALEKVFRIVFKPLVYYATEITGHSYLAEEIVQDVFMKIWEKRSEISINGSFKAYLYSAVHNKALNTIRELNSRKASVNQPCSEKMMEFLSETFCSDDNFIDKIFCDETEIIIEIAIRELPPQCREVFCKSRFEKMKNSEIAVKMGISENTVKTHIYRALQKESALWKDTDKSYQVLKNNFAVVNFPFIKGLSYRLNSGVRVKFDDDATYRATDGKTGYEVNGQSFTSRTLEKNIVIENILTYNRDFGKHTVFVTALYSYEKNDSTDQDETASRYNSPENTNLSSCFTWLYKIINASNTIINNAESKTSINWLGGATGAEENKNRVIGEAKAIRAWAYRHIAARDTLFPIPQSVIDANLTSPMPQNPGW